MVKIHLGDKVVLGCAIEDDTRRYRGGNVAGIECSLAARSLR